MARKWNAQRRSGVFFRIALQGGVTCLAIYVVAINRLVEPSDPVPPGRSDDKKENTVPEVAKRLNVSFPFWGDTRIRRASSRGRQSQQPDRATRPTRRNAMSGDHFYDHA
ncbi:hypothetical protein GCM10022402_30120 [Salinactinospora qingdaonensis]|uniref:Uncharacterized protein n=1 Tax=Salinactinospora qingdaonensis TaxID=702744 RepID=A0ABP7FUQ8_9ACTN